MAFTARSVLVTPSKYDVAEAVASYERRAYNPGMQLAAALASMDTDNLIELAIGIQQVPAPTFEEYRRACHVTRLFEEAAADCGGVRIEHMRGSLDRGDEGTPVLSNVVVTIPGQTTGAPLVVSGHLDTVFPPETLLSGHFDAGVRKVYGPGIGDNSIAVASLVVLCQAICQSGYRPAVPLVLVANAAEEGLGDLQGIRLATQELEQRYGTLPAAAVVVEGMALGFVYRGGIGVKRFGLGVTTDGGHSWADAGSPSAIHTLVGLLERLVRLPLPDGPKTAFNIGTINGGTSVNTIAASATAELDLRSETGDGLLALEKSMHQLLGVDPGQDIAEVTDETGTIVRLKRIGYRPAGQLPEDHWLVAAGSESLRTVGVDPVKRLGSTDVNALLAAGVPAICVGVTTGANAHRTDEYVDTDPVSVGIRQLGYLVDTAATLISERAPKDKKHEV